MMKRSPTSQWRMMCASLAMFVLGVTSAHATPTIDCPLRNTPYSVDGPLMDILLKPEAMAALEQAAPGVTHRLPPRFANAQAPSFSAIMTLRLVSGYGLIPADHLASLDAALRALPITQADKIARCARYDNERAHFAQAAGRPRILLFEKMTGFRDGPSVEAAHAAFVDMAARNHWSLVSTDRGGAINASTLRNVDLVIWNNVSGDVLTISQRRALQAYMERGGGFVGVHGSAGDPVYFWDWYADTLIGARFIGHPMNPQFQEAQVQISTTPSGIGADLTPGWRMTDEWYSFAHSPRASGASVVASLDESTYSPVGFGNQQLRMGDHPIAWTRCVRNGRMFYSAIGHRPETYSDPHYVRVLEQAIVWAADQGPSQCRNGVEAAR